MAMTYVDISKQPSRQAGKQASRQAPGITHSLVGDSIHTSITPASDSSSHNNNTAKLSKATQLILKLSSMVRGLTTYLHLAIQLKLLRLSPKAIVAASVGVSVGVGVLYFLVSTMEMEESY